MNNGTSALIASMMAHQIQPGDEVIVPSFSFFATAASVVSVGATPVFADIDPETFCLSPAATEAAIKQMGASHSKSTHGEIVIDKEKKVVTTPCYMLDARVDQIGEGAENLVLAVLDMT